jgi:large subunit ribosomal protein L17
MKNKINKNNLGRKKEHRKAMLRNMANSFIKYEKIKTTKTKARELKKFIEPLVTRAKEDSLHNRRIIYNRLRNKNSVSKLFEEIGPKYVERNGGYTRRYLLGKRHSDSSEMALVEFVEDEIEEKPKKEKKSKKEKSPKK